MLLPNNIHPENTIYYNGAVVISTLSEFKTLDTIELFDKVKEQKNMTLQVFLLCLDWLYLISVAEVRNGKVELCF